jgi:hypothetical protein
MSIFKRFVLMTVLISSSLAAHGEECPLPPVTTESHAVCLAENFAKRMFIEPPGGWKFEIKKLEGYWHVIPTHIPDKDFTIEKSSGAIHYGWGLI